MEAHISLSAGQILAEIYALSALRHICGGDRPALLCRDRGPALRRVLNGAFGRLVIDLLPLVTATNVAELDEDTPHLTMTLRMPDGSAEDLPGMVRALAERALARMVTACVYADSDAAGAEASRVMAAELCARIRRACGADRCDAELTAYG